MKKHLLAVAAASALAALSLPAVAAPAFADVMVLMDESGSMAGEQAWIAAQIPNLDTGLIGAGLTPNQFGLIGFGASAAGSPSYLRGFNVAAGGGPTNNSPGTFGTSANFATSAGGLVANGAVEDGWAAIALANTLGGRSGAARNYILVSDEDRDDTNSSLTYANTLSSLTGSNILLNAIVSASYKCGTVTAGVLGIGSGGEGYIADGLGGYTTATGCTVNGLGDGSTVADYVNLAIASGGAAWDLNLLRGGGVTATSFTKAFIDIKVEEITNQTPEPGSLLLAGAALLGLGAARRRKSA
jgi:hypothetical protein